MSPEREHLEVLIAVLFSLGELERRKMGLSKGLPGERWTLRQFEMLALLREDVEDRVEEIRTGMTKIARGRPYQSFVPQPTQNRAAAKRALRRKRGSDFSQLQAALYRGARRELYRRARKEKDRADG